MYRIDTEKNSLTEVEEVTFSELKLRERQNLQEWIAKNPEVLDEDLLIIQKEFSGFADTRERLDLLAVSRTGEIVVIENKLDDSGRDVVWQSLKYASYCSTLTTEQIINLYADYLKANGGEHHKAKEKIVDFVGGGEEDLLLNDGGIRIIMIANQFRKEFTSTALWLLDYGIKIECYKITPYRYEKMSFVNVQQIIPLPDTLDYTIQIQEKERDTKEKVKKKTETHERLISFWQFVKSEAQKNGLRFFDNVTPAGRFYMGFSKDGISYYMSIGREGIRVEMYHSHDPEKDYFKRLAVYKEEIDKSFGDTLVWERLEGTNAWRVKWQEEADHEVHKLNIENEEQWSAISNWYLTHLEKLINVLHPVWKKIK